MKDRPPDGITAYVDGARGLERILLLETKLARVPAISRAHRQLTKAIEIAAAAYRMTLDDEQASASHDPNPLAERAPARRAPHPKRLAPKRSHA